MTAEQFEAWLSAMGFSGLEAARRLGCADNTAMNYRRKGAPLYIGLACAAIARGLRPWGEEAPDDGG